MEDSALVLRQQGSLNQGGCGVEKVLDVGAIGLASEEDRLVDPAAWSWSLGRSGVLNAQI